jgi:hypothetical protein
MSDKPQTRARPEAPDGPPVDSNLRTREISGPPTRDMKRFNVFLIDTGWNAPVSKIVRTHLRSLFDIGGYHTHDNLYELSPQQSAEILKHDPVLIGHDPTIVVYDLYVCDQAKAGGYHGFRLNLGLMRHPEQAMARLQEFVRFVAMHRCAERLDREVRRELHREGIEGIVKLLRETSVEMLIE